MPSVVGDPWSDGYLLAVLVALVLLAMLAAYMCLLREEMHSDFEEFRAWRLRWQEEEGAAFPLPPFQLELIGTLVEAAEPPQPELMRSSSGRRIRYALEVFADGQLNGKSWRPAASDIIESSVKGKLRMNTCEHGELRWHEQNAERLDIEVKGWLFIEGQMVHVQATYHQCGAKSGEIHLRGHMQPSLCLSEPDSPERISL
ncbi:unnamed protein product [Durusdinium trenchii]|uniref:Uncharacterized protein n=1 Tax=Durusdinium trenchii TaxID=1381693 RepID=A0ABP0KI73_9DINO